MSPAEEEIAGISRAKFVADLSTAVRAGYGSAFGAVRLSIACHTYRLKTRLPSHTILLASKTADSPRASCWLRAFLLPTTHPLCLPGAAGFLYARAASFVEGHAALRWRNDFYVGGDDTRSGD